jgi:CcmD family protein
VSYVAAAYLVTMAVLALYVWTLWARQRDLHRRADAE